MATMKIHKEVEATPDLVAEQLNAFRKTLPAGAFPAKEGDVVKVDDRTLEAIGAIPGMPVLVLASSQEVSVAVIAFYSVAGHVGSCVVNGTQIKQAS